LEQLRKVGDWLWRNKEKLVLAGLVLVLIYQVYKVKFAPPEETEDQVSFVPPRGTVSGVAVDDLPPPPPPEPDRPDTKRMVRSNPFSAIGLGTGEVGPDGQTKPDLKLLRIMPWTGNTNVAEIRSQTLKAKRYGVGDSFESFRIISIDPNAQEVVVYSEEHRSEFTLTPEGD